VLGVKPLNQTELEVLDLCFMNEHVRTFFKLCVYTGLRPREALSLRVGDVAEERVHLAKRFSKGRAGSRSIKLHADLISALKPYVAGRPHADALFMADGKVITYVKMWRWFKHAVSRANIKGRTGLHSGRKTFAKHVYEHSGKDLVFAARMLGHADVKNTSAYLSYDTAEYDAAVASLRWGR
jgi:integrase